MKFLIFIIVLYFCLATTFTLAIADGRSGYDQFGEYVEKSTINQKNIQEAELKRLEEKLIALREKLKKNPNDSLTNFLLGNLYAQINRPNDAILAYKTALESKPLSGEVHYNLARAYDAIRDGKSAVNHVKRAYEIFKENLYIHQQTRSLQLLRQLEKHYGTQ
tara:strand:- start:121 stop:609 length:489 start_codon:yes stop_codon:yes gene_type:complete